MAGECLKYRITRKNVRKTGKYDQVNISSGSSDRGQDQRPGVRFLLAPHQDQKVDSVDTVDSPPAPATPATDAG